MYKDFGNVHVRVIADKPVSVKIDWSGRINVPIAQSFGFKRDLEKALKYAVKEAERIGITFTGEEA